MERYTAFENEGVINFEIGVISGELRIDVPFNFSTGDVATPTGRAEGKVVNIIIIATNNNCGLYC